MPTKTQITATAALEVLGGGVVFFISKVPLSFPTSRDPLAMQAQNTGWHRSLRAPQPDERIARARGATGYEPIEGA